MFPLNSDLVKCLHGEQKVAVSFFGYKEILLSGTQDTVSYESRTPGVTKRWTAY